MKATLLGGVAAVMIVFGLGFARPTPVPRPADTLAYSVKIDMPGATGSGVVIGHAVDTIVGKPVTHSLVITCAHVVTDDFTVSPPTTADVIRNGKTFHGRLIAVDVDQDLALLEVDENWPVAPIFTGALQQGEPEIVVGHPLGEGLSITQGFVGTVDPDHPVRQGSASAWPGNSGGGVFGDHGGWKLIGLIEMVRAYGMGGVADNISYFIPVTRILAFLKSHHV